MLILASKSPRRKLLLEGLHVPFKVVAVPVDEVLTLPDDRAVSLYNAELKAAAVADLHPHDLVLGADTVIVLNDRVIGKPRDRADAVETLLDLSGKTHDVITGMVLLRRRPAYHVAWTETTRVTFKLFDRSTVEEYIGLVQVSDKAGAYAIQTHGDMLIERIDGSLENVIGLPLLRLQQELKKVQF